ncbi:MAG: UDP-glucose/GDP-mannose dehydrogenase family protein [Rhodospirillales bacterium]|nr:UDP-glucose/GDP-mannose dehydrogenase family protein [Rhodospirillales bacterium]
MRIVMIGDGYVGLVSGACFADLGSHVTVVEADHGRLTALKAGRIPIYEPDLDRLVVENIAASRLSFTHRFEEAVGGADAVFLAVGTPSRRGDGHADLGHVFAAAEGLAAALTGPTVVVTKSTVPVGTGRRIAALMAELRPDLEIEVVSNPEFLREGSAIRDFMRPDRVVIGVETPHARAVLGQIYGRLALGGTPLLFTGLESAELIKYAANGFLAMKVTYINEMADLCERLGADVLDVAQGIGLDRRIGGKFLAPGPGFGGSCFPKDTLALMRIAQDAGAPSRLIEAVIGANDARKSGMAGRIIAAAGGTVRGRRIGVLGLAFKPDTDDLRDAPAIGIIHRLSEDGAKIRAYDPVGMEAARGLLPGSVHYCRDAAEAAQEADALVIVTEWNEFRSLSADRLKAAMRGRIIIDLRNIFEPEAMRRAGLRYHPLGRPPGRAAEAKVRMSATAADADAQPAMADAA